MFRAVITGVLLTLFVFQGILAQNLHFQEYSLFDGLPSSKVYSMHQDSKGFLWLGTDGGGLVRTDGNHFEVYNTRNGLSGNMVRAILEDSKGGVWIGTSNGLDFFNGDTIQSFGKSLGIETGQILCIAEDKQGTLLIGTEESGLFMVSLGQDTIIRNITVEDGLINNIIMDIDVDEENRYWLSMYGGVSILTVKDEGVECTSLKSGFHFPGDLITCGEMDPFGDMWFGTREAGMFKINKDQEHTNRIAVFPESLSFLKNESVWDIHWSDSSIMWVATENHGVLKVMNDTVVTQIASRQGLPTNQVYRILEDRDQGIWLATLGNGVFRYSGEAFITYSLNESHAGGINVSDIVESEENELLIASDDGLYLIRNYGQGRPEIEKLPIKGLPENTPITSMVIDHKGMLWLGTNKGLYELHGDRAVISRYNGQLTSNRVRTLLVDNLNRIWVGTARGYNVCISGEVFGHTVEMGLIHNEIQTMLQDEAMKVWVGTFGGLVSREGDIYKDFDEEEGLYNLQVNCLALWEDSQLLIGTAGGGIYMLNTAQDDIEIKQVPGNNLLSSRNIFAMIQEGPGTLIATTESGFDKVHFSGDSISYVVHYDAGDGYCKGSNNSNAICRTSDGKIWFGTSNSLVSYSPGLDFMSAMVPEVYISNLKIKNQEIAWAESHQTSDWFHLPENLVLRYNQDHLTFEYTSIHFSNPRNVEFSYLLDGHYDDWSVFSDDRSVTFQGLAPGEYRFLLKARSKFGKESEIAEFEFQIKPPFWRSGWFLMVVILASVGLVLLIIRLRTRRLKKDKEHLQRIVDLRTWEILKQKEQIVEQRDVLVKQQEEMEASMEYAKHIQQAILPGLQVLDNNIKENFILLLPQQIVSGDFFWIGQYSSRLIFSAADCTGHGIPGSLMSMLGISLLNKIVNEDGITMPDHILNVLRSNIIDSFHNSGSKESGSRDGIDMAICTLDLVNGKLYYAGAMNPLYQVTKREGEFHLLEHKADRMPVGDHFNMEPFTLKEIEFNKGDSLYLFSDGFNDQFGGEKGKKFMKNRFKKMLLSSQHYTMPQQREHYLSILEDWIDRNPDKRRDFPQTDDILLMGLRL